MLYRPVGTTSSPVPPIARAARDLDQEGGFCRYPGKAGKERDENPTIWTRQRLSARFSSDRTCRWRDNPPRPRSLASGLTLRCPPQRHDLRTAETPARRILRPYSHLAQLGYHLRLREPSRQSLRRVIRTMSLKVAMVDRATPRWLRSIRGSKACRAEGGHGVPPCRPLGPLELMKVTPQRVEPA